VVALQKAAAASSHAEETVRSLALEVGARISGGPKDAAAVAWAKRALESVGLRVHTEAVKVPHWERGAESVEIVGDGARKLRAVGLGGTRGTDGKSLEGDVVEVASLAALDALDPARITGKIVFVNAPMRRTRDGTGYGDAVGVRFEAPMRAGEKGALAAIIRSIGTDTQMAHTGATRRKATVPGVALSGESADALHELLATQKHARVKLALGARWLEPADSANVVGDFVGRERPGEIVLMGAHLDSWDVGQGAIDDGAGCAIVLEAARLLVAAGRAPKRTVRVVLFAAEELGISGGEAYAELHAPELRKHVVAMEADSGTAKAYAVRFLGGPVAGATWNELAARLAPLGIARARDDKDARGGADIREMIAKGVPVVDIEQDFSLYFDVHHTDADTLERIDPEGLRQAAAAYATAAWTIADTDADLGRAPSPPPKEK
jgi:carboxypeptidase Q